jgi:dehydrogenase/reductase SDR family protein 12
MPSFADLADRSAEALVVPSFSRLGYDLRRRLDDWRPLDTYDLTGRVALVTGATSGLGRHAAARLAGLGAAVVITGRDADAAARVRQEIITSSPDSTVDIVVGDLAVPDDVREIAAHVLRRHDTLDVVIHNAGALLAERTTTAGGHEVTIAAQVLGPFLLTTLLLDRLRDGAPGRVITVSSGGMYTAPLAVGDLEMSAADYRGADQYARAKRAQVTLNEMWADRTDLRQVVFHALHPGWADTPGLEASLPRFRRLVGPLLRSAEMGTDTLVWLAADDGDPLESSGDFWLDRRTRPIHRLRRTAASDTPDRRAHLWAWCLEQSGASTHHAD